MSSYRSMRRSHKFAIVRSMTHQNRLHDSASTETLTGRQSHRGIERNSRLYDNSIQRMVASIDARRAKATDVPYLHFHGCSRMLSTFPVRGRFLGNRYDPIRISGDPSTVTFDADAFKRPDDLPISRLKRRKALLETLIERSADPGLGNASGFNNHLKKALELMQSERLIDALKIEKEPQVIRETYGLYPEKPAKGVRDIHGYQLRGQNCCSLVDSWRRESPSSMFMIFVSKGKTGIHITIISANIGIGWYLLWIVHSPLL